MKVWISKYALTAGIEEMDDFQLSTAGIEGEHKYVKRGHHFFRLGKDAHETRAGAVAEAEKMRKKKIASVRKQLARLEAMTFS